MICRYERCVTPMFQLQAVNSPCLIISIPSESIAWYVLYLLEIYNLAMENGPCIDYILRKIICLPQLYQIIRGMTIYILSMIIHAHGQISCQYLFTVACYNVLRMGVSIYISYGIKITIQMNDITIYVSPLASVMDCMYYY